MELYKCYDCGKYFDSLNKNGKCDHCEENIKIVASHIIKRFGGVIKRLVDR